MAIVVLRGLLTLDEDHSVITNISAFRQIGIESKLFKFELEPDELFESAILGHSNLVLDQGPLTVAALGWNPPERSVHFHLSLLSLIRDSVGCDIPLPTFAESKVISEQMERLNTDNLTVLLGEGLDHALVREQRLEIRTTKPSVVCANGLAASLPEGDNENEMRRFIDDSINLLAEQEFNVRRTDHGIAPINLCWPWGQGERQRIPNRALELGVPWRVRAHSLALRGLAKLSGFRPEKLPVCKEIDFRSLGRTIQGESPTMTIIDFEPAPTDEESREAYLVRLNDLGTQLIEPLLEWRRESKSDLCFIASNQANQGLAAFCVKENARDLFPFDERSLTERRVDTTNLTNLLE